MKVINNSKIDVTVCTQIIGINKSLIIDTEVWKKEYGANASIRDMICKREIIAVLEKPKNKKSK